MAVAAAPSIFTILQAQLLNVYQPGRKVCTLPPQPNESGTNPLLGRLKNDYFKKDEQWPRFEAWSFSQR